MYLHQALAREVIGAAIEVHKCLGPGLLEATYEECLAYELTERKIPFERQKSLPITYKNIALDCAYRIDILAGNSIIVELKAVDEVTALHEAQLLTYLKLARLKVGLLINFNVPVLYKGIKRLMI
jgi:GxxExxY protein